MSYSRSLLLYEDKPAYGFLLKSLIVGMPVVFLFIGVFLFSSGNSSDGLVLLFEGLFIGAIFWAVFPRRYQVFEDHLRIVLGNPFSVKIVFTNIKAIKTTGKLWMSVNFCTRFGRPYVEIARKKGMSVAITPGDNDSFVENATKALDRWSEDNKVQM